MPWTLITDYTPNNSTDSQIGPPLTVGGFQDPTSNWNIDTSGQLQAATGTDDQNAPLFFPIGAAEADTRLAIRITNLTNNLYLLSRGSYSGGGTTANAMGISGANTFYFYQIVAGALGANQTDGVAQTINESSYYDLEYLAVGNSHTLNLYSVSSPSSAMMSGSVLHSYNVTDSSLTAAGDPGMFAYHNSTVSITRIQVYTDVAAPATTYTLSLAPSPGTVGTVVTATVTPNGTATGNVTLTPSGCGTSTPQTVAFSGSTAVTASFSPTSVGTLTVTGSNTAGLTNPSPATDTIATRPKAVVSPSGEALILQFQDGSGNPSVLTAILPSNDAQTISLSGLPSGGAFTLTFDGQTTASIPVVADPPSTYADWVLTGVPVGVAVQLADTFGQGVGIYLGSTSQIYYEVYDGSTSGTLLWAGVGSGTTPVSAADFTYGTYGDGNPIYWHVIGGVGHTFTSATGMLVVRESASAATLEPWYFDAIQVLDLTTNVTTVYDDQAPGALTYHGDQGFIQNTGRTSGSYACYDGTSSQSTGTGMGPVYDVSGGAAALQSALESLSTILSGGIAVTATNPDESGSSPYLVRFQGPMGNVAQPVMTCSDSAIQITHTVTGGVFPAYSVNGGAWVPLNMLGLYALGNLPYIQYNLPQSVPEFQYGNSADFGPFGGQYAQNPIEANSVSGQVSTITGGQSPTALMTFTWNRLPPGTYQFALTWPTSLATCTAAPWTIYDGSGTVLASGTIDQTVAPSDFTYNGFGYKNFPAVTIAPGSTNTSLELQFTSDGATGLIVIDAARFARTSADQSVAFAPTDVVQVQIPNNYFTTSAGSIAGTTITAVNTLGGSLLGPIDTSPKTMQLGYNVEGEYSGGNPCALFSNLARRITTPIVGQSGFAVSSDSNGYPTLLSQETVSGITVFPLNSDDGSNRSGGLQGAPAGLWTVIWDWDGTNPASTLTAESIGYASVVQQSAYTNHTGTVGNVAVFLCQGNAAQFTPDFALNITSVGSPDGNGHYPCSLQNLRIYPPNPSDPTGMTPWGITSTGGQWVPSNPAPPTFHPNVANYLGSTSIVRLMDIQATNNNSYAELADFCQDSWLSRVSSGAGTSHVTVSDVVSITNVPEDVPIHFCVKNFTTSLVTTATPHGMFNYCYNYSIDGAGTATFPSADVYPVADVNPTTSITFDGFKANTCWVVDDYRFLIHYRPPYGAVEMTSPVGAGGTVTVTRYTNMSLAEMVEFCNTFNLNPYWNIVYSSSTACQTALAAYWAANLKPGLTLYLELGNELWNFFSHNKDSALDDTFQYLLSQPGATAWSPTNLSGVTDDFYAAGAVNRLKTIMVPIWQAAWSAAGRSPTTLKVVLGADPGGVTNATDIIPQANAQGFTFDYLTYNSYVDNALPVDLTPYFYSSKLMTVGQALDQLEMLILSGYFNYVSGFKAALVANGFPNVQLCSYEGSLENLPPNGTTEGQSTLAAQINRHPRFYRCEWGLNQYLQNLGYAFVIKFYLTGHIAFVNGVYTGWSQWYGWGQQPGTGDPTIDTYNMNDPFNIPYIVSEAGGAQHNWASLVSVAPPPPPTKPKRLIPGRNGQIRTTGFPRGAFRPTR